MKLWNDSRSGRSSGAVLVERASTITLSTIRVDQVIAGRFRILRHIGSGGMGDVYEALDLQLNDRVALKTIRAEIASRSQAVERFKREILLAKKVTHPNVCRIYDLGFDCSDGRKAPFLTMEFLGGETLSSRIGRGRVPVHEAEPLILDMLDGLAAAHRAGIVLRDFKSSNVMLVTDDRTRAVITDFGLSCLVRYSGERAPLTEPGVIAGTVDYMAPEQLRGEGVTPAADLYALGVVMYEMLTGRRPFAGDAHMSVALKQLNETPRPPSALAPQLDPKWNQVILKCLRKSPNERFDSARAVKNALLFGATPSIPEARQKYNFCRRTLSLVILTAILLGSLVWPLRGLFAPGPVQHRVAVLEFEDSGGRAAICAGLMETLPGRLMELKQFAGLLSVVPASELRGEKVISARDAHREFGADLVITGSVQRSAGGARVIVNLIDARKLRQLRSSDSFVQQTEAAAIERGIVAQVADLLGIELRVNSIRAMAPRYLKTDPNEKGRSRESELFFRCVFNHLQNCEG
jgi:TolB-like protein